jgi:hypothetical protein
MKRLLAALFLALVVALVGASGVASADPTKDFAVGGFQSAALEQNFGFSAHTDGPNADDAWGHMSNTLVETGETRRWRVVCLAVLGSTASLGLEPQNSAASDTTFSRLFVVRDSGLPGGTGDTYAFVGGNPQECQSGLLVEPPFPIENGDILVHDAQP